MHRDLNDIIPPSRRRAMGENMVPPPVVPPPPVSSIPEVHTAPPAGMTPTPAPVPSTSMPPAVPPMRPTPRRKFRSTGGFPYVTALIAVVVLAACGAVLYAFAGAKVSITPVMNPASVASDFSATAGTGDLPFQLVTVESTASASVPAESTETAHDPSSGKIAITNRQTSTQALIKNTRFQTPGGLVFRIRDSVSIPAGGTITVTVYADEAGEKYNVGPTTFTIPGLKGSTAYTQVTAASDAPMAGGFSGTRPSVAQATKDKQYADIQTKLAADLAKELATKTPAGYVLLPGASFTEYTPQTDAAGASGTVTLTEKGKVTAVIFPASALAQSIAFKSVGTYSGQPVELGEVSGLMVKPAQPTIAPDATQFDFNLTGNVTVIWKVDAEKIAGAVAGKSRADAEIALKSFPEVDKATLVLRPFWASSFPGDPAKIKVLVNAPTPAK